MKKKLKSEPLCHMKVCQEALAIYSSKQHNHPKSFA